MSIDRLVRRVESRQILGGVSDDALDRYVKTGVLPAPTKLSRRVSGWPLSVLERVVRGERMGEVKQP